MQSVFRNALSSSPKSYFMNSRCLPEVGYGKIHHETVLPMAGVPFIIKRTKKTVIQPSSENTVTATSAIFQPCSSAKIYDKKPFKFTCIAGKSYLWCSCGWSKSQPFCDSTHKNVHYKITMRPIRFIPKETKEYVFCNCKQTKNRPFCDGSHMREDVQAAIKS